MPGSDVFPHLDLDRVQVARDREVAVAVIQDHETSVAPKPPRKAHAPGSHGAHRRSEGGEKLHPLAKGLGLELGVDHTAELADDRGRHRQFEGSPKLRKVQSFQGRSLGRGAEPDQGLLQRTGRGLHLDQGRSLSRAIGVNPLGQLSLQGALPAQLLRALQQARGGFVAGRRRLPRPRLGEAQCLGRGAVAPQKLGIVGEEQPQGVDPREKLPQRLGGKEHADGSQLAGAIQRRRSIRHRAAHLFQTPRHPHPFDLDLPEVKARSLGSTRRLRHHPAQNRDRTIQGFKSLEQPAFVATVGRHSLPTDEDGRAQALQLELGVHSGRRP